MAPTAPRVISVQIPVDKIGELIGPKGKTINAIQDETGADISIEEDGTVYIGAVDGPSAEAARAQVNAIANPTNPEVGEQFLGTVVKIADVRRVRLAAARQGRPAAHHRGAQARRRQARRERRRRARRRPEDPRRDHQDRRPRQAVARAGARGGRGADTEGSAAAARAPRLPPKADPAPTGWPSRSRGAAIRRSPPDGDARQSATSCTMRGMSFAPPSPPASPSRPAVRFPPPSRPHPGRQIATVKRVLRSRHELPNLSARRVGLSIAIGFFGLADCSLAGRSSPSCSSSGSASGRAGASRSSR